MIYIVKFEHIPHIVLVFLFWLWINKYMLGRFKARCSSGLTDFNEGRRKGLLNKIMEIIQWPAEFSECKIHPYHNLNLKKKNPWIRKAYFGFKFISKFRTDWISIIQTFMKYKQFTLNLIRVRIELLAGKKAKGWISKRVFQENKARQIFSKTNISYPLIRTRACAYEEVRNIRFSENLA